MIVEAFIIRRRARFSLWLRLRARGLIENNLLLALAHGRRAMLPLLILLLNHHHMSGVFLNAFLSCLKHLMHFSQHFLHAIHMEVHNEWLVAR
jgi:hypothetical protein